MFGNVYQVEDHGPRLQFASGMSEQSKAAALEDTDLFCQMCGVTPGGIDESTMRPAEFYVAEKADSDRGILRIESPVYVLCGDCHLGRLPCQSDEMRFPRNCRTVRQTGVRRRGEALRMF